MSRDFPGSDGNYLSAADNAALSVTGTACTLACFAKADALLTTANSLVRKVNGAGGLGGYLIDMIEVTGSWFPRGVVSDGVSLDGVIGATSLTTGRWYHIAMTKNGNGAGTLRVFLNGSQDAVTASSASIVDSGGIFTIGATQAGSFVHDGRIAEAALWDIVLSDAQILALARGAPPNCVSPKGLRGYWPLWGVSASLGDPDLSGLGSHLTKNGTVGVGDHAPVGPYVLGAA